MTEPGVCTLVFARLRRYAPSEQYQFGASKAVRCSLFHRLSTRLHDELIGAVALSYHPSRMLEMISPHHLLSTGASAGACTSLSLAMT